MQEQRSVTRQTNAALRAVVGATKVAPTTQPQSMPERRFFSVG